MFIFWHTFRLNDNAIHPLFHVRAKGNNEAFFDIIRVHGPAEISCLDTHTFQCLFGRKTLNLKFGLNIFIYSQRIASRKCDFS